LTPPTEGETAGVSPEAGNLMAALARRFVLGVIVACLLAAGANAFLFAKSSLSQRGFRSHAEDTLSHLVQTEQASVRNRFNFEAMLHDLIGTGTLFVPDGVGVDRFEIEYLSGMRLEVGGDAFVIDDATSDDIRGLGVEGLGALLDEGEPQSFFVVAGDTVGPDSRFRLVTAGDVAFVVDEQILADLSP
jgi:hypothetical protein